MVLWWERVAKVKMKGPFISEGTERRREETQMENFYYACLYEALQHPLHHAKRRAALIRLKAKIVHIHTARLARGEIELRTQDVFQEERLSPYQLIKRKQRKAQREILAVRDQELETETSARGIVRVFCKYMRNK